MNEIGRLQGFIMVALVILAPPVYADSLSARGSCLPSAYRSAVDAQQNGDWLAVVAYTQASIECAKVTVFQEDTSQLRQELKSVLKYAINKVKGREVQGMSLTTPRLSGRLPRIKKRQ